MQAAQKLRFTHKTIALAALAVMLLCGLALCVNAVLPRARISRIGIYQLSPASAPSAYSQNGRATLWPGCLASWDGSTAFVSSDGKSIQVKSVIDNESLAVIPASVPWPAPCLQVVVDGGKLYVLFFDEYRGWCLAQCERGKEPEVTAILPANTFTSDGKWVTLPGMEAVITWRSSDFRLREDGALEGIVGVYEFWKGEGHRDPKAPSIADFWFHYQDGKVKYAKLGEHRDAMDFRLISSAQGQSSGILILWSIAGNFKLFLQEAVLDEQRNISISPERKLEIELPSDGFVRDFELVPPAIDDADTLSVLINTYSNLGYDSATSDFIYGNDAWELIVIDRPSFKVKSRKPLAGFSGFRAESHEFQNILIRQGRSLAILGYKEERIKDYVLVLDLVSYQGSLLNVKGSDGLTPLGFAPRSGTQVSFGYLSETERKGLTRKMVHIYSLSLP